MYAVVKFLDESDAPGIVCSHWLNKEETTCRYPNVRTNKAKYKLLRRLADPEQNWTSCRIKILHKYNTFNAACLHLAEAEDTLDSDDEIICRKPCKRIQTCLNLPREQSDEEIVQILHKRTRTENIATLNDPISSRTFLPIPCSPPSPYSITLGNSQTNSQSEEPASSHSDQLLAWMADISASINNVERKIQLVLENQTKLLSQHHAVPKNGERENDFEILGSLPVCDDPSFIELNEKISKDSHLRLLLIKVLISVGGKDMRGHIHNMLRRVLSDEVAELYSLSGKSTLKGTIKKPFLATAVSKSIFSACQRVFKDGATEVNVKEAVGDWLNQAKSRKFRRMQRHEKKYGEECTIVVSTVKVEDDE